MTSIAMVPFAGPAWRAVPSGHDRAVLAGSEGAGRYNRPGQRTLYMSGSRAGVAAAMTRYGEVPRVVVSLHIVGARLVDLADPETRDRLGIDEEMLRQDWLAPVERGEQPASWRVADRIRAIGADGLIDPSRDLPGAFHLVLFRWNGPGCPTVVPITEA